MSIKINTKYLLAKEVKEKYIISEMRDKVEVFVIINKRRDFWYIRDGEAVVKGQLCIKLEK